MSGEAWNSDVYQESPHVRVFRRTLFFNANRIMQQRGHNSFAACGNFTQEEVQNLQNGLTAALSLMGRPRIRRANKRLYDEMFKTKASILSYLTYVRQRYQQLYALPVEIKISEDSRNTSNDFGSLEFVKHKRHAFPGSYLEDLERASRFIKKFDAASNGNLVGYLIKLIQHPDGSPCCRVLLFLKCESGNGLSDTELLLHQVWSDLALGTLDSSDAKYHWASGLHVYRKKCKNLEATAKPELKKFDDFVLSAFVEDLTYQRLRLPARRRSWGKGQMRSKS